MARRLTKLIRRRLEKLRLMRIIKDVIDDVALDKFGDYDSTTAYHARAYEDHGIYVEVTLSGAESWSAWLRRTGAGWEARCGYTRDTRDTVDDIEAVIQVGQIEQSPNDVRAVLSRLIRATPRLLCENLEG